MSAVRLAALRTLCTAGSRAPTSATMIPITTTSSRRVKAGRCAMGRLAAAPRSARPPHAESGSLVRLEALAVLAAEHRVRFVIVTCKPFRLRIDRQHRTVHGGGLQVHLVVFQVGDHLLQCVIRLLAAGNVL